MSAAACRGIPANGPSSSSPCAARLHPTPRRSSKSSSQLFPAPPATSSLRSPNIPRLLPSSRSGCDRQSTPLPRPLRRPRRHRDQVTMCQERRDVGFAVVRLQLKEKRVFRARAFEIPALLLILHVNPVPPMHLALRTFDAEISEESVSLNRLRVTRRSYKLKKARKELAPGSIKSIGVATVSTSEKRVPCQWSMFKRIIW